MVDLVYVDEQPAQGRRVIRRAAQSGYFERDQVKFIPPLNTVDETISKLLEYDFKVLITDYRLSDHNPQVTFNGTDLINAFRARYIKFPCFVTTSFAEEAAGELIDTNLIFPKSDFIGQDAVSEMPFFSRVRKKISEYENYTTEIEAQYQVIVAKSEQQDLTSDEVEELIKLDGILESLLGNDFSMPSHLKEKALRPFGQLIGATEKLVEKIEAELQINQKLD